MNTVSENRWQTLSLAEQLANIGSEVGRAAKWQYKDAKTFESASARALELIDLTLEDPRWRSRLSELGRLKEVFCDGVLGGKEYGTDLANLENYFLPFMNIVAREYSLSIQGQNTRSDFVLIK
mgnify:CR=1 FL=1